MKARLGLLAVAFVATACTGGPHSTKSSAEQSTGRADAVLVVNYGIGFPDLNRAWQPRALATSAGATQCRAWTPYRVSHGSGTLFEVRLRVPAAGAQATAARLRKEVARAMVQLAAAESLSLRPGPSFSPDPVAVNCS